MIIKFFNNIINYYCNFFLSITNYYTELFYNVGFNFKNMDKIIYNINIIIALNNKLKFLNSFFNSYINNYYISDFFTRNSKTMSFSSLKKYRIFKLN